MDFRKICYILLLPMLLCMSGALAQNPASSPRNPNASLPERTFESFWQTFEDHYAFFELRDINWQSAYDKYRLLVKAQTTDDSLFAILTAMVEPFQDDHINIIIPQKRQFTAQKPSHFLREFPDEQSRSEFWKMVDQTLRTKKFGSIQAAGPDYRGSKLFYYAANKDCIYLRFTRSFFSSDTEGDVKLDAKLAGDLLDSIMTLFPRIAKVLIDIRSNIGGNDDFAYAVAGRFTTDKVLGHTKKTRTGGYDEMGKEERWYIEPAGKKQLNVPVVLLTNDQTASAGDVFSLIMRALPKTTSVGDRTLGIYSDMYGFELPNKWLVSLSNQRYYAADGICYEGKGTPVDVYIRNHRTDLDAGKDPVLIAALKSQ